MKFLVQNKKLEREAIYVVLIVGFCLLLLLLRIKFSGKIYFLFMGWNLFLALLPFILMWVLKRASIFIEKLSRLTKSIVVVGTFMIWLLFIPNAPYMVTDFIHLDLNRSLWWFDLILLTSYAGAGMYMYFLSLTYFETICMELVKFKYSVVASYIILFLSALGVFLGRVMRYNSWDILKNPRYLFHDIWVMFSDPLAVSFAWSLIITMTLLLATAYYFFRKHRLRYA